METTTKKKPNTKPPSLIFPTLTVSSQLFPHFLLVPLMGISGISPRNSISSDQLSISLERAKAMSYNAASTHARYHDASGRKLDQDALFDNFDSWKYVDFHCSILLREPIYIYTYV